MFGTQNTIIVRGEPCLAVTGARESRPVDRYAQRAAAHKGGIALGKLGRDAREGTTLHEMTDPDEVVRVSAEHDVEFLPAPEP